MKVIYTRPNGTQGQVREFHSVRESTSGYMAYDPIDEITANPIATEMVRRQMRRDWEAFKARYSAFEEFRSLIAEYKQAG